MLWRLLARIVQSGALTVYDHRGRAHAYGDPSDPNRVVVRLKDAAVERQLLLNPHLALGEAYMDGRLVVERGDIYAFLDLLTRHLGMADTLPFDRPRRVLGRLLRRLQQANTVARAPRRVQHHYDLSGQLYALFLDPDRQYSCAYFPTPNATLEQAQAAKKRHLAAKLLLGRGDRVLDIGSGWGGLGLYLARETGADVTGVTLSNEQLAVAQQRAREAGLADRVRFRLEDYRNVAGPFDRIVSVGMFEHVGVPHYEAFFTKVRDLLTDDGVAVLHSIGRMEGPGSTNPWIRKYIFPGGYVPALSEVLPVIERVGLWVTDIEILRLHYAETLKAWRERFVAHWDEVARIYDERFCRMWEFYLAGSETTFRHRGHMVFQIQLAKKVDTVPLTRDYMFDWERSHARRDEIAA